MTLLRMYKNGNETYKPSAYTYSDLIRDFMGEGFSFNNKLSPRVNLKEEKDAFILELAVPGLLKKDISINVENDMLTISHNVENEEAEQEYARKEFDYSGFEKSFTLPETVDTEKISAKMENGILIVSVSKKEESIDKGPREIKIS